MADRCFDDFQVGERFVSRGDTLSEAQILGFALRYDRALTHLTTARELAEAAGGGCVSDHAAHCCCRGYT